METVVERLEEGRSLVDHVALKQLSPELLEQYDQVPWRRIAGFRDILIHDYMGVDLDEVTDP